MPVKRLKSDKQTVGLHYLNEVKPITTKQGLSLKPKRKRCEL